MKTERWKELFVRYDGNPILKPSMWPYSVGAVFNPGAVKLFGNEVLLLVRAEDRKGYSHLSIARSKDGRTGWRIDPTPALEADPAFNEAIFGLEDPRIVWLEERQEYIITCVSFVLGVAGEPPGISLISTKEFIHFERLGQQLIPPNKDACLFPRTINGHYALINRPIVEGRADIWVSFSPDLKSWGEHRVLLRARHRSWDAERVGLGPPPIETPEGWLLIYHGTRATVSGSIYRVGTALLDLETLGVTHWSKDWIFGPEQTYERIGDANNVVFPCGVIIDGKTNELLIYYGAADSVVGLVTAKLDEVLDYLKQCPNKE